MLSIICTRVPHLRTNGINKYNAVKEHERIQSVMRISFDLPYTKEFSNY